MLKDPIKNRTLCYERLRDGTIRLLDWNLVNTTLGAMLEPRSMLIGLDGIKNDDPYDSGFTEIKELSGAEISELGLNMHQWPRVFNTL